MKSSKREKTLSERFAYLVRLISVPPVIVSGIMILLDLFRPEIFVPQWEMWLVILFLGGMPLLAYPVSYAVPSLREKGREGQRRLAFLFSAVGYLLGWLYGVLICKKVQIVLIYTIYFVSLILLVLCNCVLRVRASGHGCSITGGVILGGAYLGLPGLIFGAAAWGIIFWASVKAKRHTPAELLLGSAVTAAASVFSWFCCGRPSLFLF